MKTKFAQSWVETRSVSLKGIYPNNYIQAIDWLKNYLQNSLKVYDSAMKYIFLAIFVLLAAQPVQAESCDMQDGQSNPHSQHGNMQDNDNHGMDCCDKSPTDTDKGCESMDQCGAVALAAVKPSNVSVLFNTTSQSYLAFSEAPAYRISSPPFRPPISWTTLILTVF